MSGAGRHPFPKAQKIFAVANQKGGVGKTTTALNLACALARSCRVLLVDLDPQGNASTSLGVPHAERDRGSYAALTGQADPLDLPLKTAVAGLDMLVANNDLAGAEVELVGEAERHARLKRALEPLDSRYGVILVDCPPSLGLLTINALTAAQAVILPLQCEFLALEGLTQLLRSIERVRLRFNPQLRLEGIVLTMFDRRNRMSLQVAEDTKKHFGEMVFKTLIPRNVRIPEAQSFGQSIFDYDKNSSGARAYDALARELRQRVSRFSAQTGPDGAP